MEIGRLICIKKFEGEKETFVLNTFIDFRSVKRFEDRSMSQMCGCDTASSI